MSIKLTIPGRLPGMNEYTSACRINPYAGASLKKQSQQDIQMEIMRQHIKEIKNPVAIHYTWIERNKRRDLDNVSSFGRKVIQDALVSSGILLDDGWKYIRGFTDDFEVDKDNPRIIVDIEEVEQCPMDG